MSSKKCLARVSSRPVSQECQVRVSYKSVKSECQGKVSYQNVKWEYLTKVSTKKCLTRVSSKSVSPEPCAIVSSKGVLQECHNSVWSQGISQVSLLEMWQISIVYVCQHTCRHSGSWASSCFFQKTWCNRTEVMTGMRLHFIRFKMTDDRRQGDYLILYICSTYSNGKMVIMMRNGYVIQLPKLCFTLEVCGGAIFGCSETWRAARVSLRPFGCVGYVPTKTTDSRYKHAISC